VCTILQFFNIFPDFLFYLLAALYIHVSGKDLYIPTIGLIGISFFLKNSRLNCRSRKKGRELPPSSGWRQFPALPSTPAVEPRVHINGQHTNFQFGKLQIINGDN
jgi:hypothetical protein